jgi:hypothetical protein
MTGPAVDPVVAGARAEAALVLDVLRLASSGDRSSAENFEAEKTTWLNANHDRGLAYMKLALRDGGGARPEWGDCVPEADRTAVSAGENAALDRNWRSITFWHLPPSLWRTERPAPPEQEQARTSVMDLPEDACLCVTCPKAGWQRMRVPPDVRDRRTGIVKKADWRPAVDQLFCVCSVNWATTWGPGWGPGVLDCGLRRAAEEKEREKFAVPAEEVNTEETGNG